MDDAKVKIEGSSELVRELSSKAIINTNKDALRKAQEAKAKRLETPKRLDKLEADVAEILRLLREKQ